MQNLHPLAKYFLPLGIGLLVISILWWLFQPLAHYLGSFWLQLAIAIIIGLLIWRFALGQMEKVWTFFTIQPMRGILTAVVLTAIYGGAAWAAYQYLFPIMVRETGVDPRFIVLILGLTSLFAVPAIWRLYGPVGIPGDPVTIRRGLMGMLLATTIVVGWWTYNQPSFFFNPQTGEFRFWVAEKEGRVYFHDGNSPATGEPLASGSHESAIKYKRLPWTARLWNWWQGTSFRPAPARMGHSPAAPRGEKIYVPAGQDVRTGLTFEPGDWIYYQNPEGKPFWIVRKGSPNYKVSSSRAVLKGTARGEVCLRGDKENTTVYVNVRVKKRT